jgi:hypothetical protein
MGGRDGFSDNVDEEPFHGFFTLMILVYNSSTSDMKLKGEMRYSPRRTFQF